MHAFAVLKDRASGIVVQQYLQFVRGARMVQQGCSKVLALFAQLLVLILKYNGLANLE